MRWLNNQEQRAWLGLLTSVAGLEYAMAEQLQQDCGVPYPTYAILAALSATENGTRHMTELAGIAGHSQSRLSHAVTRLEREGLIVRAPCPKDKRAVHAVLTEDGRRLLERAAPGHVALVRQLVFDRLTPTQTEALAEITQVIREALREQGALASLPDLP